MDGVRRNTQARDARGKRDLHDERLGPDETASWKPLAANLSESRELGRRRVPKGGDTRDTIRTRTVRELPLGATRHARDGHVETDGLVGDRGERAED
jgi:hypothetical protein|tara:strand:+ start:23287 stop:23577 length:291 start_codon:yes stop_codon:yes gene_type:complete